MHSVCLYISLVISDCMVFGFNKDIRIRIRIRILFYYLNKHYISKRILKSIITYTHTKLVTFIYCVLIVTSVTFSFF